MKVHCFMFLAAHSVLWLSLEKSTAYSVTAKINSLVVISIYLSLSPLSTFSTLVGKVDIAIPRHLRSRLNAHI